MKVVGVVGLPASGKGEFSKIGISIGIPVVVMGDVIRKAVEDAGLPLTDGNLGETAGKLRKEHGMDAIARLCIPVIELKNAPVVIVDGIRGDAEVQMFRRHFPGFILVAIRSPFDLRLSRLAVRGRPDDHLDRNALAARDARENTWGLSKALEEADFQLVNEGSLETFSRQAGELLMRIQEGP